MVVTFNTQTLNGLCSKDQLELLDCIDRLRLQGIDHLISLPQIIVCGDQSSGKSSVLEAISGVPFPVKGNLCTRFPTELVLRRAAEKGVRISIVPHNSINDSKESGLAEFQEELDGFEGFPTLIEKAQVAMGISTQGKGFSKDLLRKQSSLDVQLVQSVVKDYMKQPRSIILAVVSAKNDFANQVVLKFARSIDRNGTRTMSIITKPDTLSPGSESEKSFLSLARNEEVNFDLGWHVLKNMDTEKGSTLLHQRNAEEARFFKDNVWRDLPSSMLGILELRTRLSDVLLRQIATELPSLISEIDTEFTSCQKQLESFGVARSTSDEQRKCLLQISQDFQALVKAAVNGVYTDAFFENAESTKGQQQRIRAVVQNLNEEFADDLTNNGHLRTFTTFNEPPAISKDTTNSPVVVSRDEFLDHIKLLIHRTRSRELPGNFNSMVVADLFLEQSGPWESIVGQHIVRVWEAAQVFLGLVVRHVAENAVQDSVVCEVLDPAMNALLESVKSKTSQLLGPHQHIHPITYNRDYAGAIHCDMGYIERKTRYTKVIQDFFAVSSIAVKRFIDDVAIQVIEENLLSTLPNILSPVSVFNMQPELVALIAGESQQSRAQREELVKKIEVLKNGSVTCNRFIQLRRGG
ncbi:hypothetical protein SLS62_006308 [Diatrype stigma]|uniref:Uncharacterized protein n=1 Tax=Diatrype stigma TaxID=117547 RepID=A0AAN9UR36_9PEZI